MSSEIKADKWSPASGTSATIGDSGDTYTIPSGVTLNTSSATLTLPSSVVTGQTAITSLTDTDKFLVSDASDSGNLKYVEKQYLPSGSFAKLSTVDISSGDSSVNFNSSIITTTYKQYLFIFTNIRPTTDNVYFQFKESTNNGTSFLANDSDSYISVANSSFSSTEVQNETLTNNTITKLTTGNIGNGAMEGMSGQMFFSRDGASPSKGNWKLVSNNNAHVYYFSGTSYRDDLSTTNYIRFEWESGTYIGGRITCYGITT